LIHDTDAGLAFQQIGACAVVHNGTARTKGTLRPGDVLRLGGELVLLHVSTPRSSDDETTPGRLPLHDFGGPDALGIIGESAATWQTRADAAFAAAAPGHVLVLGESGVGKELVARSVHALSARRSGPWIARSAASFPSTLVDAELFGSMRNFPNAGMPERPGLLGAAHGGTLFLDEIGELPHEAQSRLLRVLDSGGEYHRLGEPQARRSDLRLVAATNRPFESLKSDVGARFALRVRVPSLRDRIEDVPLIARGLLRDSHARAPSLLSRFFDVRGEPRVTAELVEYLCRHPYSTNVRELNELLLRAVQASPGDVLDSTALSSSTLRSAPPASHRASGPPSEARIREVLASHGGSA
jgi:two-component system nitrogen regulation response regulator GlnG/two-component system response regulator HydG